MPPQPALGGYGRLARTMADCTTKGLFAALVLAGGLGFGRQVIRWWHRDDAAVGAASDLSAGFDAADPAAPVEVAIGTLPLRLRRQTVSGDQAAAVEALRAACRRYLPMASAFSPIADEEEQKLLKRLAELDAERQAAFIDKPESDWRLYEPVPGMPLVVGTRRMAGEAMASETRVALSGLASPAGQDRWTICVFEGSGRDTALATDEAWPLPPDCQRLISLRTEGAEISAFQGGIDCAACRLFFNQWQAEHRPDEPLRWQPTQRGGWYASLPLESRRSLVIQLVPGQLAGTSGLVLVIPSW